MKFAYVYTKMLIFLSLFIYNQAFATVHTVEATELEFIPADITIELGDTVRFVWIESNHAIASGADGVNDELFMPFPLNDADPEHDLILDVPGVYPYFCAFHFDDGQVGSITVLAPDVVECGELFFSEYIEGSSNNKALELYNPTSGDIDLANYSIRRYNNGGMDPSADIPLEGVIKAGDVFLIVHSEATDDLLNQSDLISSSVVNFNGNDALELYNGGLLIDLFGRVGEDPGDGWLINEMDSVLTENVTLVRKNDVNEGVLDWADGITQWDIYEQNDFSFVGAHANNTCFVTEFTGCDLLFISEYVEGTGANQAVELYNPKGVEVDLAGYSLERFSDGSVDPSFVETLTGTIQAFETFVVANASADDGIATVANITSEVASFDGNDAIALRYNGALIDVVGVIGDNPEEFWETTDGSTSENSLQRNRSVDAGSVNWGTSSNQWTALGVDNFEDLGSHKSNCGSVPGSIGFENANVSFKENDADYAFNIIGLDLDECYDFKVAISGTATQDEDYTILEYSGDTLELSVCPETPNITVTIDFIEDELSEISENIVFKLIDLPTGVVSGIDEFVVTIKDEVLPTGTIAEIAATDADGVAVNLDQTYEVTGIVYGVNLSDNGLLFVIRDETGGIAVYSGGDDFGYEVNEGDEVLVSGVVTQFRGLIEIVPFEVELLSSGNSIKEPTTVTSLDENSELDLVKIECVQLDDPSKWTNGGSGFNVDVKDGQNIYTMRINDQVDLYGMEAPTGSFDVVGIGWQFASSSDAPFVDGYQINPRSQNDIVAKNVVANFSGTNEGLTYTFVATEGSAESYTWNFGDGGSGTGSTVEHTFTEDGTYNVILTVNKDGCTASSNQTYVIDNTGIGELTAKVSIFPNPTRNVVNIDGDFYFDSYKVYDITGKTFIENRFPETNNTQIDFTALTSGMYFLQITGEAGTIIEKIKLF